MTILRVLLAVRDWITQRALSVNNVAVWYAEYLYKDNQETIEVLEDMLDDYNEENEDLKYFLFNNRVEV